MALDATRMPLFLTPVIAYSIFKARISRENDYLGKPLGDGYHRYKAEVNELIPLSKIGKAL